MQLSAVEDRGGTKQEGGGIRFDRRHGSGEKIGGEEEKQAAVHASEITTPRQPRSDPEPAQLSMTSESLRTDLFFPLNAGGVSNSPESLG